MDINSPTPKSTSSKATVAARSADVKTAAKPPSAKAPDEKPAKRPRGFAAMDAATQRRIASEGGRASHLSGRGHRFTPEEARAAGRKGGQATRSTAKDNPDTK